MKPQKATHKKEGVRKRAVPGTWRKAFVAALRETGNVSESAKRAEIDRASAYRAYTNNSAFAAEWDDALEEAVDALELEARRRALKGNVVESYDKDGNVRSVRTEYSDVLMIVLLKAHRPDKFKERTAQEITGRNGGPLTSLTASVDLSDASDVQIKQMIANLAAATMMPVQLKTANEPDTPDSTPGSTETE